MPSQVQKLLGPWTLQSAIKERVEKEALAEWALKADEPFEVIPPMTTSEWQAAPMHALARGMFREVRRLMP